MEEDDDDDDDDIFSLSVFIVLRMSTVVTKD